eukprot:10829467-Ditylum_brightwellii.AAC.1
MPRSSKRMINGCIEGKTAIIDKNSNDVAHQYCLAQSMFSSHRVLAVDMGPVPVEESVEHVVS